MYYLKNTIIIIINKFTYSLLIIISLMGIKRRELQYLNFSLIFILKLKI